MSDVLAKFGVDAATVASLPTNSQTYPKTVPGRVAHIDADFMAYQVSAESKEELDENDPTPRKTYEDMQHNAFEAVDHIRLLAAAERAVLHTTTNSDKGGRDTQAILKQYQAQRIGRERPEHLTAIKKFLSRGCDDKSGKFTGINHTDQEADDGMTQALYADPENCIMCSADKDLLMVPGWRLNMVTYEITRQKDPFGFIELDRSKSSACVVGRGTKFFWAQCLMGDTADNISGIPKVPGAIWQQYAGTKAYAETYQKWIDAEDKATSDKLDAKLKKLTDKPKLCGPVLTFDLLKDARDDKECYRTVKACYTQLATEHGYEFKHWKTGKVVTPTQALLSEMQLLWMRRHKDPKDVVKWIKETI